MRKRVETTLELGLPVVEDPSLNRTVVLDPWHRWDGRVCPDVCDVLFEIATHVCRPRCRIDGYSCSTDTLPDRLVTHSKRHKISSLMPFISSWCIS